MKNIFNRINVLFIVSLFFSFSLLASDSLKSLNLPIGKSKCPSFSFKVPFEWILKSGRKKGDRWILWDEKKKEEIGYFAYNLPNTDQKMLPEVFGGSIKLGSRTVEKYTVTLELMEERTFEEMKKAKTGLITSFSFSGKLEGLYFMSSRYDMVSGREKVIEIFLSSIQILGK